jgi:short-subunit dehydrogenase
MTRLKNCNALITGAASGLGLLMAEQLLAAGAAHVTLWDINDTALNVAVERLRAAGYAVHGCVVDITSTGAMDAALADMDARGISVDVLINNAGIIVGTPFVAQTDAAIDREMAINAIAPMHLTLRILPRMIAANRGHLVTIASAAGLVSNPRMAVYCASKWAAVGWSDSIRLELAQAGSAVNVTTVTPYYTTTGMFAGVRSPIIPIIEPIAVVRAVLAGIQRNAIWVRTPWIVTILPLVRGLLPTTWFDVIVGKWLGVYDTMRTFTGRRS